MMLNNLIEVLQFIESQHGDITVNFQAHKDDATEEHPVVAHESFFVVEEGYESGMEVNLRTWPY